MSTGRSRMSDPLKYRFENSFCVVIVQHLELSKDNRLCAKSGEDFERVKIYW